MRTFQPININMVLNKSYYPNLCSWNSEVVGDYYTSQDNGVTDSTYFLDHDDKKIFLVTFCGTPGILKKKGLKDFISADLFRRIKNKEIFLMIHCSGHGYHHIVRQVYQDVIIELGLDPSQVILSSESADLRLAVDFISKEYNIPSCHVQWTTEFEQSATLYSNNVRQIYNIKPFEFESKNYLKKFVCLNGVTREHRTIVVWGLASLNLLDQGFVSFNIKTPDEIPERTFQCMETIITDDDLKNLFITNKEKLLKVVQLKTDQCYDKGDNLAELVPEHDHYFNNCYFSLITETNFDPFKRSHEAEINPETMIGRLYSEKTFRAILYKHPFIITGPKHYLKLLRDLGYKTFHPYIDESYDEEDNPSTRLLKILKETERLCKLDKKELYDFLQNTRDICEHNRQILHMKANFKRML